VDLPANMFMLFIVMCHSCNNQNTHDNTEEENNNELSTVFLFAETGFYTTQCTNPKLHCKIITLKSVWLYYAARAAGVLSNFIFLPMILK
jgi:hypothetical protein